MIHTVNVLYSLVLPNQWNSFQQLQYFKYLSWVQENCHFSAQENRMTLFGPSDDNKNIVLLQRYRSPSWTGRSFGIIFHLCFLPILMSQLNSRTAVSKPLVGKHDVKRNAETCSSPVCSLMGQQHVLQGQERELISLILEE